MTTRTQKSPSSYRLTEIDSSSGNATRTYTLTSTLKSKQKPQSVDNDSTEDHKPNKYILQLAETHGLISSRSTSDPTCQKASEPRISSWSPRVLLLTYYNAILSYLSTLFLPTGYPHSVTSDYTPYQIYDSLQAFASSIAGLLSSRAVLQSLNVLDSSSSAAATATAATLLSIVQSTLSNLTTILFASHAAPRINTEVKYYRFLADIVNDAAFVLDLLAPSLPSSSTAVTTPVTAFPQWFISAVAASVVLQLLATKAKDHFSFMRTTNSSQAVITIISTIVSAALLQDRDILYSLLFRYIPSPRTTVLCLSSVLRAICGVAGGSSKAVLSAHFARNNPENIGDLNAKDGSQETVIGLLGMWFGGVVVSRVEGSNATWLWMMSLLTAHLCCNWKAVQSVRLRSLNRQRATLICETMSSGKPSWKDDVSVDRIGARESVLGLRSPFARVVECQVGVSLRCLLVTVAGAGELRSIADQEFTNAPYETLSKLSETFKDEQYILGYDSAKKRAAVALKINSKPTDQLKAWLQAHTIYNLSKSSPTKSSQDLITKSLVLVNESWEEVRAALTEADWDLELTNLEEVKGVRLQIDD